MTKKMMALVLSLLLCLGMSLTVSAAPADGGDMIAATDGDVAFLLDAADLLTATEEKALSETLCQMSQEHNTHLAVAAVHSVGAADIDFAIADFYDEWDYGYGEDKTGVLLLVVMDIREYRILSNGRAADRISLSDIDEMSAVIEPYLRSGDYAGAFDAYVEECDAQLSFAFGKWILIALGVGLAVGLVVALVLKGQLRSVRAQDSANVYVRAGSMHLTKSGDFFMYRTVTKTAKPKNTSSSGGSSSSSRNVGGGKF